MSEIATRPTDDEILSPCDHLWVRRREGSWCARCRQPRLGVELSEEERRKLAAVRAERSKGMNDQPQRRTDEEIRERIVDMARALADQRRENAIIKTAEGATVELALESNISELYWVLGE